MGRKCNIKKETALEALYQVMKRQKILQRPGPTSELFYIVKNAINLWKSPEASQSKSDYWNDEQMSSSVNRKKRELLLQTISTWFDRRGKKKAPNKNIEATTLNSWIQLIETNKNTSIGDPVAFNIASAKQQSESNNNTEDNLHAKKERSWLRMSKKQLLGELQRHAKENRVLKSMLTEQLKRKRLNSLDMGSGKKKTLFSRKKRKMSDCHCNHEQHDQKRITKHTHGKGCGHIGVIHKSPAHSEPHLDFLVDGVIDCKHGDLACCSDHNDSFLGNFEVLDEDFDIAFDKFVELLD